MAIEARIREDIERLIKEHRVVLFMKGTRFSPSCGFSASVVGILDGLLPRYHTVDILEDPLLREAIKEFSEWPTIPQLYVDAQFVGGADIVRDMHVSGDLKKLLGGDAVGPRQPTVTASEAAARELREASKVMGTDGAVLRLEISARFDHDLFFGEPQPGDLVVDLGGVALHLDAGAAFRGDGLHIAFLDGPGGKGFKLENPNEPAKVRQIPPTRLKEMFDAREAFELVDVRTPEEWERASIAGAQLFDEGLERKLAGLDRATTLVFQCHHGVRSLQAAEHYVRKGFRNVYNLQGGIDAWSVTVDPTVPRY